MSKDTRKQKYLSLSYGNSQWCEDSLGQMALNADLEKVHTLKDVWDALGTDDDYVLLLVQSDVDLESIYDLLSTVPTVPKYVNLPIVIILEPDKMKFKADFEPLGANAILCAPEGDNNPAFNNILEDEVTRQISRYLSLKSMQADQSRITAVQNMEEGRFHIRTREEAQHIASLLSCCAKQPTLLAVGLAELAINGVEHGMLGIDSDRKNELIQNGKLSEELSYLSQLPENKDKFVKVCYEKSPSKATFIVEDPGQGFDFGHYLNPSYIEEQNEKRAAHGRGIGMAKACFETLTYVGNGNKVIAVFNLDAQ